MMANPVFLLLRVCASVVGIAVLLATLPAAQAGAAPPVTLTADQDHQNMMDQLGIKAVRAGPSGDESAPNHANYDESLANPYPDLPDVLTLKNGTKVTTPEMWWKERRPEIVEDLEREVYGRLPAKLPKVTWTTTVNEREFFGGMLVVAKQLVGHVDNSAYPAINVDISMTLVVPANARGPVPVLMMFGRTGVPSPVQPSAQDFEKLNAKLKALLAKGDPTIKAIFDQYPGYNPFVAAPFVFPTGRPAPGSPAADPPTPQQLLADGMGLRHDRPGQHPGR